MTRQTRLYLVLGLNLVLLVALIVVGLTAHSLGVLAAGGDYLADSAALVLALVAVQVGRRSAARDPGRESHAPAVAAMVTAGTLLAVMLVVLVESVLRLLHGATEVHGLPVLIVSGIAAVIMGGGVALLLGDTDEDEQVGEGAVMRAVTLDTIADAAAATGVAITGAIILATGRLYWLDPAVAAVISTIVGYHAVNLLRDLAPSRPWATI